MKEEKTMSSFEFFASAAEAWQSIPLVSFHVPGMGSVTTFSLWSLSVAAAVLIFGGFHCLNHRKAPVRTSGALNFQKAVTGFWNTQTLERVHFQWRSQSHRFSVLENSAQSEILKKTNRLPRAWCS